MRYIDRIILAMLATVGLVAGSSAEARSKPNQRQIGDMTAQCTVTAERAKVRALLATLPGSADEARVTKRLAPMFEACSDGAYLLTAGQRNASLFNGRADLAAAMAVEAAATGRRADKAGAGWYLAAVKAAPSGGYDAVLLGVQEFGACVVGADPDGALKLVRSDPGSRDESAAVTALRPALAPCVVQGSKLNFTRDELRLAVAEPLYHALTGVSTATAANR